MLKNVLTMPGGDSSIYTHPYGVYSIQKDRNDVDVEPLCQDPNQYFALRERGGGAMHWLYQVVSGPGLVLDPMKPLSDQIKRWHERLRGDQRKLTVAEQERVSKYMSATMKGLGGNYGKEQLFYVLGPWQHDKKTGSGPTTSLGRLIHGPRPAPPMPMNLRMAPTWYSLEDVLKKRVLG